MSELQVGMEREGCPTPTRLSSLNKGCQLAVSADAQTSYFFSQGLSIHCRSEWTHTDESWGLISTSEYKES